ncbi:MAG: family N-acetyltransferase [Rhodoferax sp.]|nr:family N-acetyltransferase [Rhodoferax sp.]
MTAIRIARLRPEHAAAYRALMLQAYADHPEAFSSSPAERQALPLSWWQARVAEDGPDAVFGALRGTALVGVAGVSFELREKTRHKATLFGMSVGVDVAGQGVGWRLVEAVLDHARAQPGARLVQLTVTEGNAAAEALYRRCGFVPFGVEPLATRVGDVFFNKVHLWCDLRKAAAADLVP